MGKTLGQRKGFQHLRRKLMTPGTSNRTRLARIWSAPRPSRSRHMGGNGGTHEERDATAQS